MNNTLTNIRVIAYSPKTHIGNVSKNVDDIIKFYNEHTNTADVILTPELSMTGYTCADLFNSSHLKSEINENIFKLRYATALQNTILIVGLPLSYNNKLYNCACVFHKGECLGAVPKVYLPNYGEFYEARWFTSGNMLPKDGVMYHLNHDDEFRIGNIIFECNDWEYKSFKFGIEICEDAWSTIPPSSMLSLKGAEIIFNLSASNEVIGKAQYRTDLIKQQSAKCICGYVYCSSGMYESTSDLVFGGHKIIAENGKIVKESALFNYSDDSDYIIADINLDKIRYDRCANKTFGNSDISYDYTDVPISTTFLHYPDFLQNVNLHPFVPKNNIKERCNDIFNIQVAGLQRRIEHTHSKHIVIGVSGGLDSTLALLVAYKAVKNLGMSNNSIVGVTMPCFGTTDRTKSNAIYLMEDLGCDIRTVDITKSVTQHLKDIGHPDDTYNIAFENAQARERTQVLMDIANEVGGFVLGTGDLSELCLGWCTYNGDHMSMYGVNNSIPKTLVRTLVDIIGKQLASDIDSVWSTTSLYNVIDSIVNTKISPELLPPNADGSIAQSTEDSVGSYILNDFFIYYHLRWGMSPEQICQLCNYAVKEDSDYNFSNADILKWLKAFYKRFYNNQFKRNCMPDGVKVGTVSVSPRGDLRLPSEVDYNDILAQVEALENMLL